MTELLIFACIYVALALLACIRLGKGPTLADRAVEIGRASCRERV